MRNKIATGGRSERNVRAEGGVRDGVNGRKSMETSSSSETISQSIPTTPSLGMNNRTQGLVA